MHSEARRPGDINLDRFVERLDARLRAEVTTIKRVSLPRSIYRALRAPKIRAMALLRGGAIVVTTLALMVAFGTYPAMSPSGPSPQVEFLERPTARETSSALVYKDADQLLAVVGGDQVVAAAPPPGMIE